MKIKKLKEKQSIDIFLKNISEGLGIKLCREFQGLKPRLFRFDWAFPERKIAIEYEGLNFANYAGGKFKGNKVISGHLTIKGYTSNCDKYNLAVIQGWKVLRYTAKNYKNIYDDIPGILIQKQEKGGNSFE